LDNIRQDIIKMQ